LPISKKKHIKSSESQLFFSAITSLRTPQLLDLWFPPPIVLFPLLPVQRHIRTIAFKIFIRSLFK
jgi:hypothetical protein